MPVGSARVQVVVQVAVVEPGIDALGSPRVRAEFDSFVLGQQQLQRTPERTHANHQPSQVHQKGRSVLPLKAVRMLRLLRLLRLPPQQQHQTNRSIGQSSHTTHLAWE